MLMLPTTYTRTETERDKQSAADRSQCTRSVVGVSNAHSSRTWRQTCLHDAKIHQNIWYLVTDTHTDCKHFHGHVPC